MNNKNDAKDWWDKNKKGSLDEKLDNIIREYEFNINKQRSDFYKLIKPGDLVRSKWLIEGVYAYREDDNGNWKEDTISPTIEPGKIIMYIGRKFDKELSEHNLNKELYQQKIKLDLDFGFQWLIDGKVWTIPNLPVELLEIVSGEEDKNEQSSK